MLKKMLTGLMLIGCFTGAAQAETFSQAHPRRAEVLARDNRIANHINCARYNDNLTRGQANRLRREDATVRRQEQLAARLNGGYITRGQQAYFNREENGIDRQIRHDEWRDNH